MDDLYKPWINDARAEARTDLRRAQNTLDGLKNVGSTYYQAVMQMRDARRAVLDVLMAQPDAIPPAQPAGQEQPT